MPDNPSPVSSEAGSTTTASGGKLPLRGHGHSLLVTSLRALALFLAMLASVLFLAWLADDGQTWPSSPNSAATCVAQQDLQGRLN